MEIMIMTKYSKYVKEKNEKIDSKKLYPDEKYQGVRKRYAGQKIGIGYDWVYYIQYRDRISQKVILKKIGKLSEGITAQKAAQIRDQLIFESINQKSNSLPKINQAVPTLSVDEAGEFTLLDIWEDYQRINQNKVSVKGLATYFNNFQELHLLSPNKITNRMIQDLRYKLEHKKTKKNTYYSPKTVTHHLKLLQTLINHGIKREMVNDNIKLRFEFPKFDNRVTEFLSEEQLAAYKKALEEDKDKIGVVFLTIALYTGMRKKAILNLKWSDINFKQKTIQLRGETAKNGKTNFIPMPETVNKAILTLPYTSEYLFTGKGGKPRQDFRRTALRVHKKACLPKNFRPVYMLRHNFASQLASSGVELYTIQKLMTHESPQMTQRYAHLSDKTMHDASHIIEDLFNKNDK